MTEKYQQENEEQEEHIDYSELPGGNIVAHRASGE